MSSVPEWAHEKGEALVKMNRVGQVMAVMLCVLAGCASTGERVDIAIPGIATSPATAGASGTGLRVARTELPAHPGS